MKVNYTVHTQDFFGDIKEFQICWKVDILNRTFVVGVDLSNPNEVSLFEVIFERRYDTYAYTLINTYFWNVYKKHNFSIEEKVQKDIKGYFVKEFWRARLNKKIKTF